jgi:hypothetical protein
LNELALFAGAGGGLLASKWLLGWIAGVVVAFMVCEPMYVCGEGDDRDTVGEKLLGCENSHVRSRPAKSS